MGKVIKNVIFDLGGVLVDLDKQRCLESFHRIGFHQIDQLLNAYYPQGVFRELELGAISVEQACEQIRSMSGRATPSERIMEAYRSFLGEVEPYKLHGIERLRQAGIATYVLSNNNEIAFPRIRELFAVDGHPMEHYFDEMFLSYRLHQLKPDREIFESMIRLAGLQTAESLFIDDGELNTDAARELGFEVHLARPQEDFAPLFDRILRA